MKTRVRPRRKAQPADALYRLLSTFGDFLTGYRLEYADTHSNGVATRFQQAALTLSQDGVQACGNGVYRVKSNDRRKPHYTVYVSHDEMLCSGCEDSTNRKNNPSGVCYHQLAALMRHSIEET